MNTEAARWRSLVWKAWCESRGRYLAALGALVSLVGYTVLAGPQFLAGLAINHPGEGLTYAGFIWVSLFDFYLQGFWIACVFILAVGGIRRERATGVATFTLSLPVTRRSLVTTRAAVAIAQAFTTALLPCLLISVFAALSGYHYSPAQAFTFGFLLATGGLVFVGLTLLLSSVFEGEYTAFLVGGCAAATLFFAFKARSIHRSSIFDVMSGARHIDPTTYAITSLPWLGLTISVLVAALLVYCSVQVVRRCDF